MSAPDAYLIWLLHQTRYRGDAPQTPRIANRYKDYVSWGFLVPSPFIHNLDSIETMQLRDGTINLHVFPSSVGFLGEEQGARGCGSGDAMKYCHMMDAIGRHQDVLEAGLGL